MTSQSGCVFGEFLHCPTLRQSISPLSFRTDVQNLSSGTITLWWGPSSDLLIQRQGTRTCNRFYITHSGAWEG